MNWYLLHLLSDKTKCAQNVICNICGYFIEQWILGKGLNVYELQFEIKYKTQEKMHIKTISKAAIPRFSIRIRMRIRMLIRKVSMRTPYSTFQYPSNISVCVYLTINSAYIISLLFTWKCNVFLSTMWWTVIFLSYIRVIFQGYDVLGADYGFDI